MDRRDEGMKVRREVLGDEHVDRSLERVTEFTAEFQDLLTRYAWGEIWTRPGLDRKTRSCLTLVALVALGRCEELELHVQAALRNGLTPDEIKEVLLHCAVYCGVPAANTAFADRAARPRRQRLTVSARCRRVLSPAGARPPAPRRGPARARGLRRQPEHAPRREPPGARRSTRSGG